MLAATYLRRPLRPWLAPLRGLVGERFFALPMPGWMIRALMAGDDAPPEVVALVREAVAGVRPEVLARRAAEGLAVDAREALRRVEVPVLCLAAIRDRLLGGRGAEEVRALCPGATVIRIEAPHMVLQRAPQACLLAIERFADRVGGRTGPARGTRGKGEGDPAGPQRHREEPQRRSPRLAAKRKHEASRQPPSSTGRPAPTASEAASRGRRA